jgi:hypothetical protein
MNKLAITLTSLLAGAMFALTATAAEASSPIWYHGTQPLLTEYALVKGAGTLTLTRADTYSLKCKVTIGPVGNGPRVGAEGASVIGLFRMSPCSKPKTNYPCPKNSNVEVISKTRFEQSVPAWIGFLVQGPPIRNQLGEVEIEVHCAGTELGEPFGGIGGSLSPEVTNKGTLRFGPGSGELMSPFGGHLTLSGSVKLTATEGSPLVHAK